MSAPYDLLLRWLSERSAGGWDDFKAAHAYVFSQPGVALVKPSWALYVLSTMGHVEMDWASARWSVARPCLVGLPNAGATAVLVGSRPASLLERLDAMVGDDGEVDAILTIYGPEDGPACYFVQYDSVRVLEQVGDGIAARLEHHPAGWIRRRMPTLEDILVASQLAYAAPRGYEVEVFDPSTLRWEPTKSSSCDGLYRYRAYGMNRYYFNRGGELRDVDADAGVWLALQGKRTGVVRYAPAEVNGSLEVPAEARLPLLQARCAVLCSGRPPIRTGRSRSVQYRNVTLKVADAIARSLGQTVSLTGVDIA